jgi:16S rRNA (uracil1498-N3)-methyltransferase
LKSISRPPLFLCRELTAHCRVVVLRGDEAIHAGRSRRIGAGDRVHLTDGRGLLAQGRVVTASRSPASLEISLDDVVGAPEPNPRVVLASALPKGDRLHTMLDMATQLGMQSFVPLDCRRSVVRWQPRMMDRCQRVLESAAKQCRQPRIPRIQPVSDIAGLVADADADEKQLLIHGSTSGVSLCDNRENLMTGPWKLIILVGPEGGLDPAEETLLDNCPRALAVRCGDLVLRTETAALALLAAVTQWLAGESGADTPNKP